MPSKARLDTVTCNLFGAGEATWTRDEAQAEAAWEIYVVLTTRLARDTDDLDHAVLEALDAVFESVRDILLRRGVAVARAEAGHISVGEVALRVLTGSLRPFLAKWQPALGAFTDTLPEDAPWAKIQAKWPERKTFRAELKTLGEQLDAWADFLAEAAGVAAVHRGA